MTNTNPQADTLHIERLTVPGYEDVRLCEDAATGLRAIVAVHDTRLGPALGGTRFYAYPDDDSALRDVKRLSRGMTYKAAAAGLALGGGKAVIIGDPSRLRSPELFRAYGRFVDTFEGRYISAADVGTTSEDLDIVGTQTAHVTGRTVAAGGLGDSGMSTALGVLVSMRAAVRFTFGRTLRGTRVGVEGVGKVGFQLVSLLLEDGADVRVAESHAPARARFRSAFPQVPFVEDLFDAELDVYAPCALGATLTSRTAGTLSASIVCGAANNQLADDSVVRELADRGVLWVPDYVANAGGLIQVAMERDGGSLVGARERIRRLDGMVSDILQRSRSEGSSPLDSASAIVDERLAAVGADHRLR